MIEVVRGELGAVRSQGVLRPVTAEWTAVTPAMRRLDPLIGPEIEDQCRKMGELPLASALVTGAGGLAADLLIHVIVRSATQPVTAAVVSRGLVNGLLRAEEWGIGDLALPPLGTGAGNLDAEESADVMVPILQEWLRGENPPRTFRIVVDNDYEFGAFDRKVRQAPAMGGAAGLPLLDP
jgi:O-acetyl-ADP-ribose deacetylase (regulator of RNase III)